MTVPRKRNIAGFMDDQGRFRPIRSPEYVGTAKRKAKASDKKKYSPAKAGDLGKRRQERAREDVFDKAVRKQREANEKAERLRQAEMREIERDVYGKKSDGRLSPTLMQFVRSSGGIRRTYRHRGRKAFGRRSSYDAGEIDRLSYKETGKRGLTTDKGGLDMDYMFQAAREAGYDVTDIDDMMSRIEDEAGGGRPTYATHGSLSYNPKRNMRTTKARTKKNPARPSLNVSDAEFAALQAETRRLVSRMKNVSIKRNPVGWFKDVSPVTPEAVKKLYRRLAAQWHPDKAGGDLRKMQQINADYDKAMNLAAKNEGNEHRADAERKAAKPLREAIEFAVTLPDNINVVIRGLWLWLEGNTYAAREQIKSFKSSDGNYFKWANKKKAWFFAAVPSSNRRGEMSFDEIDRLHGRELVNERKHRLSLNPKKREKRNPIHPITAFATGASGILSALQIKEHLNRSNAKTKTRKRSKNPTVSKAVHDRAFAIALNAVAKGDFKKINTAKLKGKLAGYSTNEIAQMVRIARLSGSLTKKPVSNPKRSKTLVRRTARKVPHRRTFSMFSGRPATKANAMPVSRHAPARLDQLGDLIEVKLTDGQILKTNPKRFKLCASGGKLWIAGGKFAKANPAEKTNVLNPVAEIAHVVYGTYKPHHGDNNYTHYIHKLGEVSGRRPVLAVDREGFPVIRGGNYKIEARGIVD